MEPQFKGCHDEHTALTVLKSGTLTTMLPSRRWLVVVVGKCRELLSLPVIDFPYPEISLRGLAKMLWLVPAPQVM